MTTQGKKTAGGSFNPITTTPTNLVTTADPTLAAVPAQVLPNVATALNQWHNAGGTGTAAQAAQALANAAGVTIQEV